MQDNKYNTEDISRDSSITTGNFNQQFDNRVTVGKDLQVYSLPKVLNSNTSGNVQELGVEKIDNYSGESGSGSGKIRFTDLKEAHTTSRLVDPNAKYKQYKKYRFKYSTLHYENTLKKIIYCFYAYWKS